MGETRKNLFDVLRLLTLYEYNQLNLDDRASFLWEHGTFLMNDEGGGKRVNLYALGDLYVEGRCDKKSNRIMRIRTFKSLNQLDEYLNQINL
jgi:hypothetical protein